MTRSTVIGVARGVACMGVAECGGSGGSRTQTAARAREPAATAAASLVLVRRAAPRLDRCMTEHKNCRISYWPAGGHNLDMTPRIRDADPGDWRAIWHIVREVVVEAETFAYDPEMTEDEGRALWMVAPPGRTTVAVDGATVAGTANMYPNRAGPGAHVASASFMVASAARGRGVGRALAEDALSWARGAGFKAMQFNAVAETNAPAIRLYRSLGFAIVGTVPEAFDHPERGLVGLHVMHIKLR